MFITAMIETVRCLWLLSEFMRYRPCLFKASLSPQLVECSERLTENFKSISNDVAHTTDQQQNKLIRACLSVFILLSSRWP